MSALVTQRLAEGAAEARAVQHLLLFRALDEALREPQGAGSADTALRVLAPFQKLHSAELVRKATPFVWRNVHRLHELDAAEGAPRSLAAHDLAMTAFDAYFDALPDGTRVTLQDSAGLSIALPHIGVQLGGSPGDATLIRRGPRQLVVERGAEALSLDLAHLPAWARLPAAPIPGHEGQNLLLTFHPALLEEVYRSQLLGADLDAGSFTEALSQGLSLIGSADRELGTRVESVVKWYIPIRSPDPATHCSFTSPCLSGVLFLSPSQDALRLAEAIVHELGHTELNMLMDTQPVLEGAAEAEFYYSPWRPDPRPLVGLFHGLFVFSEVANFLERLCEAREELRGRLDERLCTIAHRLHMGLAQVPRDRVTPLGRAILLSIEADLRRLMRDRHIDADAPPRVILAHLEAWRREHPTLAPRIVTPEPSDRSSFILTPSAPAQERLIT